jgi:AraC-like DNA-binding protein
MSGYYANIQANLLDSLVFYWYKIRMSDLSLEFLQQVDSRRFLSELFEETPDLYVFAKDLNYQFTMCNRALLSRLGIEEESEIIGSDDYCYFDPLVADHYRVEDQQVFHERRPITNRIWLVPNASGLMDWYLSSKFPLFDDEGLLVGLAGLMRDCKQSGALLGPYQNLANAVEFIRENFTRTITVGELAEMSHLSVSQFERSFRKYFKTTPMKYVNQVRVDAAARLLSEGTEPISLIAHDTGFYDHSYFTKQFKAAKGMSPSVYRKCSGGRGGRS